MLKLIYRHVCEKEGCDGAYEDTHTITAATPMPRVPDLPAGWFAYEGKHYCTRHALRRFVADTGGNGGGEVVDD